MTRPSLLAVLLPVALLGVLALPGCAPTIEEPDKVDPDGGDDTGTDQDTGEDDDTGTPTNECTDPAPLPVDSSRLGGFTGAEDFVFDGEGYLVSIDEQGNLVGINRDAERKVILPGVGEWTSGMHMLPDGDFVFSDASTGTLMRVRPGGGAEPVLSGMSYPNGIEVDLEGFVYVSEHDAGRVRRIDPDTGDFTILASELFHPNGVHFSADYGTLYVGSFGGGTVHAIQREGDGGWGPAQLLGAVPSVNLDAMPEPCVDAPAGEACFKPYGGIGECGEDESGAPVCGEARDTTACVGLAAGDPCTTDRLGDPVESVCAADTAVSDTLFCPRVEAARVSPCEGESYGADCRVGGAYGYCQPSWEGVQICSVDADWYNLEDDCEGLSIGDACSSMFPVGPFEGTCQNYQSWGLGVICEPWFGLGEDGGLDGLSVDACDNVYVTEFVSGVIYRFLPEGGEAEVVRETGAYWIPNMHWGNGIGGWAEDVMYVLDRESRAVYALEVGVQGIVEAYQPPAVDEGDDGDAE
jgi:sugar lactone lactonase YvrE